VAGQNPCAKTHRNTRPDSEADQQRYPAPIPPTLRRSELQPDGRQVALDQPEVGCQGDDSQCASPLNASAKNSIWSLLRRAFYGIPLLSPTHQAMEGDL